MWRYYHATAKGQTVDSAPPSVVELTLIEKFNWSIPEIEATPFRKIQEIFTTMSQRDQSSFSAKEAKEMKNKNKGKTK